VVGGTPARELQEVPTGLEGADLVAEFPGQREHGGPFGLGEVLAESDEQGLG
jgi:hypothetical protein